MVLKLSDDYRKNLLCPPSDCLDDMEKLENCINCTEISLAQFGPNDLENKRNYLQWLTKSEEVSFDIFNLDHESNFLQEIDFDRSDIFETGEALKSLSEVYLDDCGLMSLPKMATLSQLKIVSVKNNSIQKLDSSCLPSCIKKLKVSETASDVWMSTVLDSLNCRNSNSVLRQLTTSHSLFEESLQW